jgi:hypothetical protein
MIVVHPSSFNRYVSWASGNLDSMYTIHEEKQGTKKERSTEKGEEGYGLNEKRCLRHGRSK